MVNESPERLRNNYVEYQEGDRINSVGINMRESIHELGGESYGR